MKNLFILWKSEKFIKFLKLKIFNVSSNWISNRKFLNYNREDYFHEEKKLPVKDKIPLVIDVIRILESQKIASSIQKSKSSSRKSKPNLTMNKNMPIKENFEEDSDILFTEEEEKLSVSSNAESFSNWFY